MGKGGRVPQYLKHVSGNARIRIAGTDYYLGKHGSKESWERYRRPLADWMAAGRPRPPSWSVGAFG